MVKAGLIVIRYIYNNFILLLFPYLQYVDNHTSVVW